jgi:hypothetical protein
MQMTPQQRDLLIRTIVGEAASEPFMGQQAVANVVLNRLRAGRYGDSLENVILAKNQFEPWSTRKAELLAIPRTADTYRTADMAVEAALQDDVTGGATHFYAPGVMEGRGGAPSWAQNMINNGTAMTINGHVFGQADGPGTMRDDRGTAYNSGLGEAAPAGLLDAEPYQPSALPPEPDWEALKEMGGAMMKKAQADAEPEDDMPMQATVLQPLRRIKLGKGLLG